jgi:hypothetical protein
MRETHLGNMEEHLISGGRLVQASPQVNGWFKRPRLVQETEVGTRDSFESGRLALQLPVKGGYNSSLDSLI